MLAEVGYLLAQLGQLVGVVLALDGLALDFQLADTALNLVQFLGHRVNLQTQFGGGLVNQVDSLVRQETVADITVAQLGGGDDGLVLDTHLVVHLVTLLQSTQNADGVVHIRLVDQHTLETAFQRLVLFEILLILGQGGGTDSPQFATSKSGLQDIGCIHGPLATAGTHQRVYLVDEEDNLAVSLVDLADNALQPLLELAFILGACNQRAHVQTVDGLALQVLGHVAAHNAVRQALGYGRFTHTGLADEDGVVLGPAAEDLQHAAYLLVTSYHGVQLASLRQLVQVLGILVQGVVGLLGALAAHLAALAQVGDGGLEAFLAHARIFHQLSHFVAARKQP